jgi:hypothetical protein
MPRTHQVAWHCPNRDSNWSFLATETRKGDLAPQCICGGTLKKGEVLQVLKYLDFLRACADVGAVESERE